MELWHVKEDPYSVHITRVKQQNGHQTDAVLRTTFVTMEKYSWLLIDVISVYVKLERWNVLLKRNAEMLKLNQDNYFSVTIHFKNLSDSYDVEHQSR